VQRARALFEALIALGLLGGQDGRDRVDVLLLALAWGRPRG